MRATIKKIIIAVLVIGGILSIGSIQNHGFIPLSSGGSGISPDLLSPLFLVEPAIFESIQTDLASRREFENKNALQNFMSEVIDGSAGVIRGVYSEEKFALPVVQQPAGQAAFVSSMDGVATQFLMSSSYGVTGLLAHNYLAGQNFFLLDVGDEIQVVFGNEEVKKYRVADVQKYQALQPNSPSSQFVNLFTGEKLSATQLFNRVYMGSHHLTLQTCIQEGSIDTWGRMFIIAYPI